MERAVGSSKKDKEGRTELFREISKVHFNYYKPSGDDGSDDEYDKSMYRVMEEYPNDIKERDYVGGYPLHAACNYGKSYNVIKKILDLFPRACKVRTKYGNYPLHCACHGNMSYKVIVLLLTSFPIAVQKKNNKKEYPLHLAIDNELCDDSVIKLYSVWPEAATKQGPRKQYPLHLAIECRRSLKIIALLLQTCPEAVDSGEALYLACRAKLSEQIIFLLLDSNLLAVKSIQKGFSILDWAEHSGLSKKIISVFKLLTTKTINELENRIGIPIDVTINGLGYVRRQALFQWCQINFSTIDPKLVQRTSLTPQKRNRTVAQN
jgi:ankyrin repeat protein